MTYDLRVSERRAPLKVAMAAALLLVTAACGGDSDDTAEDTAESTAPSGQASTSDAPTSDAPGTEAPDCAEVWVAGATLPRGYQGCEQGGETVRADRHPCSYGAAIVEFDDRFYAVTGKKINEVPSLAESQQFEQALSACQA